MFQLHFRSPAVITNIGKFRETGDGSQKSEDRRQEHRSQSSEAYRREYGTMGIGHRARRPETEKGKMKVSLVCYAPLF